MLKINSQKLFILTTTMITSVINIDVAFAQKFNFQLPSENLISLEYPSSSSESQEPRNTAGAAMRGGSRYDKCVSRGTKVTALMPNKDNFVQTVSEEVTFLFNIPENKANFGRFILLNQKGEHLYTKQIPINKSSGGIVEIASPKQILTSEEIYTFQFSLFCDDNKFEGSNSIDGFIEKITLNPQIESELQKAVNPIEKAKIYADQLLWLETLNSIASIRQSEPTEWAELLKSVGLGEFVDQPFLD